MALLAERPLHPEMVDEFLSRCRDSYWFDADSLTDDGKARLLDTFVTALTGIPARFAEWAFEHWLRTMSRRPSPGEIANQASRWVSDARFLVRMQAPKPPDGAFKTDDLDEEALNRRRDFADRMMRVYGFARDRHLRTGGGEPEPMTDADVDRLRRTEGSLLPLPMFRRVEAIPVPDDGDPAVIAGESERGAAR